MPEQLSTILSALSKASTNARKADINLFEAQAERNLSRETAQAEVATAVAKFLEQQQAEKEKAAAKGAGGGGGSSGGGLFPGLQTQPIRTDELGTFGNLSAGAARSQNQVAQALAEGVSGGAAIREAGAVPTGRGNAPATLTTTTIERIQPDQRVFSTTPNQPGRTITRRTTRPNVLTPAQAIQLRREAQQARQAQIQATIESEGFVVGNQLFEFRKSGEGNPNEILNGLVRKHGPTLGRQIFNAGIRRAQVLAFEERQSRAEERMKSELTEERQKSLVEFKEAMREGRPTTDVKNEEARILLKIARGEELTTAEQKFLDERQQLSLRDRIERSVIRSIGEPSIGQPEPNRPNLKTMTEQDFNRLATEFMAGRDVWDDSAFLDFARDRGFQP